MPPANLVCSGPVDHCALLSPLLSPGDEVALFGNSDQRKSQPKASWLGLFRAASVAPFAKDNQAGWGLMPLVSWLAPGECSR